MKHYLPIPIGEYCVGLRIDSDGYICPWNQDLRGYNLFEAKKEHIKHLDINIYGKIWGDL